jgi:hypothetical protein
MPYGLHFQSYGPDVMHPSSHELYGIPTLVITLVVLLISMLIGVVVTFIGLAFHHERRYLESHQHELTPHTTARV